MRNYQRILVVLLAVGFAIRLSGIFWGMALIDPLARSYHPDEEKVLAGALGFPGHAVTNTDLRYPTLYAYSLGLLLAPLKLFAFESKQQLYEVANLVARFVTVIVGTWSIYLTYELGRRLIDRAHGVVAAALLCFAFFHAQNSAWVTTDVLSCAALVVFLLTAFEAWRIDGTLGKRVVSGVALGALVAAKYTGGLAAIVIPIIWLADTPTDGRSRWQFARVRSFVVGGVACGLAAATTLVATTPGIVLFPDAFVESIRFELARMAQFNRSRLDSAVWIEAFDHTSRALGWPLAVVALAGLFWRGPRIKLTLVALVVGLYSYFGDALFARYLILVMPCLAVCAAQVLVGLTRCRLAPVRWGGWLSSVAVFAYSIAYTGSGLLARYPDTRTEAAQFIEENVPDGTSVGIAYLNESQRLGSLYKYPKVDFDRLRETDYLEYPDVLLVSSYDLDPMVRAVTSGLLSDDYRWPEDQNHWWYRREPPTPAMFRFFSDLLSSDSSKQRYEIWRDFNPDSWVEIEFGPPRILICRKRDG